MQNNCSKLGFKNCCNLNLKSGFISPWVELWEIMRTFFYESDVFYLHYSSRKDFKYYKINWNIEIMPTLQQWMSWIVTFWLLVVLYMTFFMVLFLYCFDIFNSLEVPLFSLGSSIAFSLFYMTLTEFRPVTEFK